MPHQHGHPATMVTTAMCLVSLEEYVIGASGLLNALGPRFDRVTSVSEFARRLDPELVTELAVFLQVRHPVLLRPELRGDAVAARPRAWKLAGSWRLDEGEPVIRRIDLRRLQRVPCRRVRQAQRTSR
jgi:hypothetical protein